MDACMSARSSPCPVLEDGRGQRVHARRVALWRGLTAGKGILVRCACIVRYLYTPTLAHGIVVKIDIGAFVEAVMRGRVSRRGQVVMHICEAVQVLA